MNLNSRNRSIKSWSEDDQPREKLLSKGRKSLSDAELITILLRSGSKGESALSLAKRILQDHNHNLYQLGKLDVSALMEYKGVGEAKAITLLAALELGRRRQFSLASDLIKITSSHDAYQYLAPKFNDLRHEEFHLLLMDTSLKVIKEQRISTGGINMVIADVRLIMKTALENYATAIIIAHNHPTGNLHPSKQDKDLTNKVAEAGKIMGIKLADHLIITDHGYFSFSDEGFL